MQDDGGEPDRFGVGVRRVSLTPSCLRQGLFLKAADNGKLLRERVVQISPGINALFVVARALFSFSWYHPSFLIYGSPYGRRSFFDTLTSPKPVG